VSVEQAQQSDRASRQTASSRNCPRCNKWVPTPTLGGIGRDPTGPDRGRCCPIEFSPVDQAVPASLMDARVLVSRGSFIGRAPGECPPPDSSDV